MYLFVKSAAESSEAILQGVIAEYEMVSRLVIVLPAALEYTPGKSLHYLDVTTDADNE